MKIAVINRVVARHLKPTRRHVLFVLGLALPGPPLLLDVALAQLGHLDALSRTTKFAKLEKYRHAVVLRCALGGNNRKKKGADGEET